MSYLVELRNTKRVVECTDQTAKYEIELEGQKEKIDISVRQMQIKK